MNVSDRWEGGECNVLQLELCAGSFQISVENLTARQPNGNELIVDIEFNAANPTSSTFILEAIKYDVFTNSTRVVSGDIGEKLEGFVASPESVFPVIAGGIISLKDSHTLQPTEFHSADLEDMLNGKAHYTINGTYSVLGTSSIEANSTDRDFEFTFN